LDVFEAIYTRRSIRQFKVGEKIPEWKIEKILDAARHAPSPENVQAWKYIVIRDQKSKELLADLAQETSSGAFGMSRFEMPADRLWYVAPPARVDTVEGMFDGSLFRYPETADTVILCCYSDHYYDLPTIPGSIKEINIAALSMAIQNMWLAATELGVGAGWDSFPVIGDERRRETITDYFSIPKGWSPLTAFCLGVPVSTRVLGPTRYPMEGVVFKEAWGIPYIRSELRR
jgi:5,6-dimethylbenzimidazole synthase